MQNMGYYIHFQSELDTERAPMLLVSVVGCHYLQVFGATWNEGCVCIDPLCTPVSLLYVPRDPLDGITKTAHVLAAILCTPVSLLYVPRDPLDSITKTARVGCYGCYSKGTNAALLSIRSGKKGTEQQLGAIFCTFGACTLEYKQCMCENDYLYEAKLNSEGQEKEVVVKFVRSPYGKSVHQELANNHLAPELIHHQILPGGWNVVVMEMIKDGSALPNKLSIKQKESVLQLQRLLELKKNCAWGSTPPKHSSIY